MSYFPSVVDGSSEAIDIPRGLPFGQSSQMTVYVCAWLNFIAHRNSKPQQSVQVSTNGYFSFGEEPIYNTPQRFSPSSPQMYIVAPFWSNTDISNRVWNITYEVHTEGNSQNQISSVSSFISQQQQVRFSGNWMLVAQWNSVPQFRGSLANVSPLTVYLYVFYWLMFTHVQTNTFQGIVITNGQQSYALFTYQCGLLGWSGGATIGFTAAGKVYQNHHLSGTYARNIACLNSKITIWTNVIYQLSKYGYMHEV